MKAVHVAVGVVVDANYHILLSLRADHQHQGGRWEFPGGKVEVSESVQQGLARELDEELGVLVREAEPLCKIRHTYPDKQVILDVWWVTEFTGQIEGKEGQEWRWVPVKELDQYKFPDANTPILEAIRQRLEAV